MSTIIAAIAATLGGEVASVQTAADAAKALEPIAGPGGESSLRCRVHRLRHARRPRPGDVSLCPARRLLDTQWGFDRSRRTRHSSTSSSV